MRFLISAEKCKKRDLLGFFNIHCVEKYRNKRRGDPLVESKKIQKKSHSADKDPSEKHQKGDPMFSRFWTSMFLFWTRFWRFEFVWTSVVQVDDVEQMNKKVDEWR